jgi:hypothetical protein
VRQVRVARRARPGRFDLQGPQPLGSGEVVDRGPRPRRRPAERVSFATLYKNSPSTRWTYRFEGDGPTTKVTESFDAVKTPPLIALAERLFLRNRQAQLAEGMAKTLSAIKAAAEA